MVTIELDVTAVKHPSGLPVWWFGVATEEGSFYPFEHHCVVIEGIHVNLVHDGLSYDQREQVARDVVAVFTGRELQDVTT